MKLVRELLLEFERGLDPREAMGVGHKVKIQKWLSDHDIIDYSFDENLHITVYENIHFVFDSQIEGFPDFVKIDNVQGSVKIIDCFRFENLANFPKHIQGNLEFWDNAVKFTTKKLKELGIE